MNARHTALAVLGLMVMLTGPTPAPAQTVTEFPVPTPSSAPAGITVGPDGALWFTEENGNKIGRITTGGAITNEFPIPTRNAAPMEITTGPDGALWFTEFGANPPKIGRITTAGVITEFDLPPGTGPDGITTGPDGAIWFTANGTNQIGRMAVSGSPVDFFALPTGFRPGDIKPGPDGRIWFTESEANKIGAITTGGFVSEYDLPPGTDPSGIAASAGAMWFAEFGANQIGRISVVGSPITHFGPTGSGPSGITFGADGALWFTETFANKVGRMTTSGVLTAEIPVPTAGSQPGDITAGPDGALWFTEFAGNKIGRVATSAVASPDGYVRPKAATSLKASLVPAFNQCATGNRQHGPPLAYPSCNPPVAASTSVTVGMEEANLAAANSEGSISLKVVGSPGPPDDSDVLVHASVSDVRCQDGVATPCGNTNLAGGPDYIGQLQVDSTVRTTDRFNATGAGGGSEAATGIDIPFRFPFACASTASMDVGGSCAVSNTSMNALIPGSVKDGKRAVWQLSEMTITDGGPDGQIGTTPNTVFMRQGVFVP